MKQRIHPRNSSGLKHVRRGGHDGQGGAGRLPRLEKRVRNLRHVHGHPTELLHEAEHRAQRPQPLRQLRHPDPQHVVLRLQPHLVLGQLVHLHHDPPLLLAQLGHLVRQILQLPLLPHPRPPRRLPVRQLPPLLPLLCREPRVSVGPRALKAPGRRHPTDLLGRTRNRLR
ncbi:unnamed protein product [Musa acuminata subsp. burmannicoides]